MAHINLIIEEAKHIKPINTVRLHDGNVITIGRNNESDKVEIIKGTILLPDSTVSKIHGAIRFDMVLKKPVVTYTDISKNGTVIKGQKIRNESILLDLGTLLYTGDKYAITIDTKVHMF